MTSKMKAANKNTPLEILYEDDFVVAVNKPTDLASVPAPQIPEYKTVQGRMKLWALAEAKGYKPYPLHRLDRQTSGVMLFGKYPRDRAKWLNLFKQDSTQKTYLALVKWIPKPQEGSIRFDLEARSGGIKVPAITHYKVIKILDNVSLLEVRIETGRKHQIRKHLAMIGHPLLLDRDYGDRHFDNEYQRKHKGRGKFFLHAWKFSCIHPFTGKALEILAPTEAISK